MSGETTTPTEPTPPPSEPTDPLDDIARVKACLVALYDFLLAGPPMLANQQHFFRQFIDLMEPVRTVWAHVDRPGLLGEPKE